MTFELLESIFLEEEGPTFSQHIDTLEENNIDIDVDDFGSGHDSIICVMNVAPVTLKIDKRLIMPIRDDPAFEALVGAIVGIGQTLKIDLTAEGVESLEHARMLRDLRCRTLQGFVFARPMPEDELIGFMRADRNTDR
ncbi:EAL domain-containing protein [Yoonia sediminilitoris]|uniref:EAL domain-containing protein n=1 Tax=Yoonia sediminilitoris TaxID=1286148 RepID=UPI001FE2D655|nr:EAL domain-containing protein [Yoonia sediminilitoris]